MSTPMNCYRAFCINLKVITNNKQQNQTLGTWLVFKVPVSYWIRHHNQNIFKQSRKKKSAESFILTILIKVTIWPCLAGTFSVYVWCPWIIIANFPLALKTLCSSDMVTLLIIPREGSTKLVMCIIIRDYSEIGIYQKGKIAMIETVSF